MVGLSEVDWMDYPKDINNGENMKEYSLSYAPGSSSPQRDISRIVVAATHATPLAIFSENVAKRDVSKSMDIDEEDTAKIPKKLNTKRAGQIV